ncbi:DUF1269 domain-containing protein [Streptomyces sp. NBS 14/10]|uniref:DUF1269 domain-containing protein n=1 Tax=Streptomyces sp. NBS 14/10 TaxID=1945643 RepID=UPI001180D11A|nr:DUF1269 domain-containing protein [Streptomyces sp. NBS 14/10]KAK1181610.1 DUF1269 domain-containing protein [Streptomyces sp. NBS 14/10]
MDLPGPETAPRALDALLRADDEGTLVLCEGAVIARAVDGTLDLPDCVDSTGARCFTMDDLMGGLVGLLGGPLGIMIGFGEGGFVGAARDTREGMGAGRGGGEGEAAGVSAALEMLAAEVPPGTTVLVADVREPSPDAADRALAPYGHPVARYPAGRVRREIESAKAERS